MNRIQQYEYIRSISDAQFEFVKDMWKRSKTGMWKTISRVVDILAAAGLVYVAYDAVDTLPTILASVGAAQLLFKETFTAWCGALTGAINYTKDIDVAKDAAIQMNAMISDINNKNIEDIVDAYHAAEPEK